MTEQPMPMLGLRHVALYVKNFDECEYFYTQLLKMAIVWRPDQDNLYLSSGTDNLALHRATPDFMAGKYQRLDHFGFFLNSPDDVDRWFEHLSNNKVVIKAPPKNHRDHTRSFYCADPDGNIIQMIYYPLTPSNV